MKKNIFLITTIVLFIACIIVTILYFTKTTDCYCKEKECEKEAQKQMIYSQNIMTRHAYYYDELKDGYKDYGIITNQEDYEDIIYSLTPVTNCLNAEDSEVATNCIGSSKPIIDKKDFDNYVYELVLVQYDSCNDIYYTGHYNKKDKLYFTFYEENNCGVCAMGYKLFEIGISKYDYNEEKTELKFEVEQTHCDPSVAKKPIMYIYPTEDINLKITFPNSENLTTTYPKYNNGWDVKVLKDGSIYQDNNYYYALYWESNYYHQVDFKEGFYVTKENAIEFLESKLSILGLNDKERNEFIMYWLPILEKNEKSLVYFETTEELNKYEPINFSIKPDSLIRIRMHVKKVDSEQTIKEQVISSPTRTGFTVVEWGGVTY